MKKGITIVFALSAAFFLCGTATYAQGRGQSAGVNQGRAPVGVSDQGKTKSDDHSEHAKTQQSDADHGSKFEARIEANPALRTKVESLLPAGTNLQTAASGFKNEGQFIAALHVSKNLNIPFDQLKAKMTGPNAVSLGKAIQELKPALTDKQAESEAGKAEKQAKETEKTKATA